jgi:hypothetical protein
LYRDRLACDLGIRCARGRGANCRHGKRHADRPPGSAPEMIHTPHRLRPPSPLYLLLRDETGRRLTKREPSDTFSVA